MKVGSLFLLIALAAAGVMCVDPTHGEDVAAPGAGA